MVDGVWFSNGVQFLNGFEQNGCDFVQISNGTDHSKTEPFKNQILKPSVFEWVRFSRPHCIRVLHEKSVRLKTTIADFLP